MSALLRYPTLSVRARAIHDTFYKRNKKLVAQALLSYISTWEFGSTRQEHLTSTPHFFFLLRIPAYLHNSTMHSAPFFHFLIKNDEIIEKINTHDRKSMQQKGKINP